MHPWEVGKGVWNSCLLPQWGNRLPTVIVSPGVSFCATKIKVMGCLELRLSTFSHGSIWGLVLLLSFLTRGGCPVCSRKLRCRAEQGWSPSVALGR